MATVVPTKDLDAVQFFETHIPTWTANHASIGISSIQVTDLDTATKNARDGYVNQQAKLDAAKAQTTIYHNAVKAMRLMGSDLIKTIKAYAATTGNPDVYGMAEIPMPAAPSPKPAPGQPTDFKVSLTGSGAIELAWKSVGAAGGFFQVSRKLAGETAFSNKGTVGTRKFTDATIPVGTDGAMYLIQGFRGQLQGTISLPVGVQFGVGGGGGGGNMVVAPELKMAA